MKNDKLFLASKSVLGTSIGDALEKVFLERKV
jgi:hypothetical protein